MVSMVPMSMAKCPVCASEFPFNVTDGGEGAPAVCFNCLGKEPVSLRRATLSVSVARVDGAEVGFADEIEVSLDCFICVRRNRTMILRCGSGVAVCFKHRHSFRARILDKHQADVGGCATGTYRIEYGFNPFVDVKDGRTADPLPKWARVGFSIRCPKCHQRSETSTQTNTVRPWGKTCSCGLRLFTEAEAMPRIEIEEASKR
jgi:hypothetical protein